MAKENAQKTIAISLRAATLIGSIFMSVERVGALPYLGILLGGILTLKLSSTRLFYYALSTSFVVALSWGASFYYVFSTWESGDVVQISLDDRTSFRTWVVEHEGQEVVIYDCPPQHLSAVQKSRRVTLKRHDQEYSAEFSAVPVTQDSKQLIDVYALYEAKYAAQSRATEAYYLLIGPRRGSQLFVF